MTPRNQKLELTWIDKENRPKLERHILFEDPAKSYHTARRVSDQDLFDNRLTVSDSLLAISFLERRQNGGTQGDCRNG